jgi:hypothetical protein
MGLLEAQVNGGMDGVCGEDGIGEFEEGVGSAVKTLLERAAEAMEGVVVRFHDELIMHSPTACRLIHLSMELKRKLRLGLDLSGAKWRVQIPSECPLSTPRLPKRPFRCILQPPLERMHLPASLSTTTTCSGCGVPPR